MKNRLILVEGIPGSGKSTIAKKIQEYLESKDINTMLYNEGDGHPADLSWCSYVPINEYKDIINKYPEYSLVINDNTVIENDFAVVAYTKLGFTPYENELMKYFEAHEVYDGRVSSEKFTDLHLKRWSRFAENTINENKVYIFECAFFQNHVCELMGIHNKENDYIYEHLNSLVRTVNELSPLIIYLTQPDVRETIERVSKERVSNDKAKQSDWIDLVIHWVEKSQYAKRHGLNGLEGVIRFLEDRKKIELEVFEKLQIDKYIVENLDYNWDDVFNKVKKLLST